MTGEASVACPAMIGVVKLVSYCPNSYPFPSSFSRLLFLRFSSLHFFSLSLPSSLSSFFLTPFFPPLSLSSSLSPLHLIPHFTQLSVSPRLFHPSLSSPPCLLHTFLLFLLSYFFPPLYSSLSFLCFSLPFIPPLPVSFTPPFFSYSLIPSLLFTLPFLFLALHAHSARCVRSPDNAAHTLMLTL